MGSSTLRGTALRDTLDQLGSGWVAVEETSLVKRWTFEDFAQALAFVNKVGALAEQKNHHPDIAFGWGKAELTLTTHDSGGITSRDVALATAIDQL
jgi:4a-hydroxytetrahydrobiopterin dehydratase